MELSFKIGTRTQEVCVPEKSLLSILEPNEVPVSQTGEDAVHWALEHPIGSPRLRHLVHPGEKIAIVSSDITRHMPTWQVMPLLLDELYAAGATPPQTLRLSLRLAVTALTRKRKGAIWQASGPGTRSPLWIWTPPTVYISAQPPEALRWTLTGGLRKLITVSAWGILNTITLQAIPAVPKPSCPVYPPGPPFRQITATWSCRKPVQDVWREILSGRIWKKPLLWSALISF